MLQQFSKISKLSKEGDFQCVDVIGCIFNLTLTDISVFEALTQKDSTTTLDVAKKIGKDRSTAHRSLEKLVSCGLSQKERIANETRGYSYVYTRISDIDLYLKAKTDIEGCYDKIETALNKLKS